jgi:hypothetical protein
MFRPVGIKSLPNGCSVTICLEAVVGRHKHEEGLTDLCSILNLLEQLMTTIWDDHDINPVGSVWLDPD